MVRTTKTKKSRTAAKRATSKRPATPPRYIKVSSTGKLLPDTAADWNGVYIPSAKLIVSRRPTVECLTFKAANAACAQMDLCGAKAERSISLREFVNHLLIDSRTAPAIDPAFFTVADPYQWIWTCDECAPAGYAWGVYLSSGASCRDDQGNRGRALAVRAGQFSASRPAA